MIKSNHCGDCVYWMISSKCPREHNVKGQHVGPSCNDPICNLFFSETLTPEGKEVDR
jgi:hypothetical protein